MSRGYSAEDRRVGRMVHRLFWQANLTHPPTFLAWLATRPTAIFIYNVLIPLQIAYGLQAIITRHFNLLGHYAITIFALAAVWAVLWAVGGVVVCHNGELSLQYLQRRVFTNYLQKDYEFYSNTYLGALGTQASRLRDALNEYNQLMFQSVTQQIIVVVASIAVLAWHSLIVAGVTLLCMGLVLGFTIYGSKWRLKYRRRLSETSSELAGIIGDALGQGAAVKSFATEEYETKRLNKALADWARTQYWSWMSSIPTDIIRTLLAVGAITSLLIITGRLYEQHRISIALVALVQLYAIKLIAATQDIANMIKSFDSVMSAAHQPVKTMLLEPEVTDKPNAKRLPASAKPEIIFENASYHYKDAGAHTKAVQNFSLRIKPGEKIGVVGYSGSGKTTLTKLLLRFMDVSEGSIIVGGRDIRDMPQADLRQRIAYVPQEPLLFHRSIAENIAYGKPGASDAQIMQAAKTAFVDEFVRDMPGGFETIVGERGVKLSGGQRQRVAIARALLKDAPILILDEATSALDSRSEKLIQQALWRLMKNRTALVIAHRLSTIQHMDRIVVMDKGRIVQAGTHDELLAEKHGAYAELWAHQSGGYIAVPDPSAKKPTKRLGHQKK